MTSLTEFRAHCQAMAMAEHKPECEGRTERPGIFHPIVKRVHPSPDCLGCNHASDRALFAQMAGEIDDYLAPQVDLFGEEAMEPTMEDA